jgi:hypothetical protein
VIAAVLLSAPACRPAPGTPRLDHVVVAVHDLDSEAARFDPFGFRFKAGRLHPDGLLNRHIKFRDHSEPELQSLAGAPTDAMARDYAELLSEGEGGVYAALWTDDLIPVAEAAASGGLPTRSTVAGAWRFLGFPGAGDASAVFFGSGGVPAVDPDSVLAHPNHAVGLAAAWVEAGPGLDRLLATLGAASCDSVCFPTGGAVPGGCWAAARSW